MLSVPLLCVFQYYGNGISGLDSLYVVGALDEALNIRGFRYHPGDIESTVVRCHKNVIGR